MWGEITYPFQSSTGVMYRKDHHAYSPLYGTTPWYIVHVLLA